MIFLAIFKFQKTIGDEEEERDIIFFGSLKLTSPFKSLILWMWIKYNIRIQIRNLTVIKKNSICYWPFIGRRGGFKNAVKLN